METCRMDWNLKSFQAQEKGIIPKDAVLKRRLNKYDQISCQYAHVKCIQITSNGIDVLKIFFSKTLFFNAY